MRIPTRMLCENIISFRAQHGCDTTISTLPYWLYLCQAEYARTTGKELCDATFEATTGGIVCPQANRIYYSRTGERNLSAVASPYKIGEPVRAVLERVHRKYGWMLTFDLVTYCTEQGSAYRKVLEREHDKTIRVWDIIASTDGCRTPDWDHSLARSARDVEHQFKNTLSLLADN